MNKLKFLAWPLYITGFAVVFFPALEFVVTIWPLSPSILSWRFGAVGLLSRSLLTPMVGVAMVFSTAVLLDHKWVRRAATLLALVGSVVLLIAIGMFLLDLLQFRNQVRAEASTAYDVSSGVALLKLLICTVILVTFGMSGVRVGRREGHKRTRHSTPAGLVSSRMQQETGESGRNKVASSHD